MTTFNWTISAVERAVSIGELADVIQIVHWRYRGTDENGVTAETYGATSIGEPNPQDFTPYNNVTSSDVELWLESILGVVPTVEEGSAIQLSQLDQMKLNLQSQIDLLNNPATIIGALHSA